MEEFVLFFEDESIRAGDLKRGPQDFLLQVGGEVGGETLQHFGGAAVGRLRVIGTSREFALREGLDKDLLDTFAHAYHDEAVMHVGQRVRATGRT